MWALLMVGAGAGFAGLAFVLSALHRWLLNSEHDVAVFLVPIGFVSILIGVALLIVTSAIYFLGRDRIRTGTSDFSSAPGRG
jgi:protease PrsW